MSRIIGVMEEMGRRGAEEVSVEWKIPNFPSLLDGRDGDWYLSPTFRFGDGRWYLVMRPNWKRGAGNPASGWVSLDLVRCDAGPPATVRFSVGIRGSGGVEKSREGEKEFTGVDDCHSWDDFCSRSYLLEHRTRLMPGDTFTITCVLKRPDAARGVCSSLPSTQVAPTNRIQSSDKQDACTQTDCDLDAEVVTGVKKSTEKRGVEALQKSLESLLAGGEDSDCLIKVRGKQFPAHRAILRARSPVFRAMFAHDTVERQSGTVTMEDCDPETFPDFLEHVYTGSVEMVSSTNVFNLYTASDKYDLSTLKEECADFMKRNLTAASFCNTVALAIQHGDQDLVEWATDFFCDNSLEIVETAGWQTFLQEKAIVGNELFIKTLRHNLKK